MLSTFDDLRQQILNNGKQLDLGQIQRAYETAEKAMGDNCAFRESLISFIL